MSMPWVPKLCQLFHLDGVLNIFVCAFWLTVDVRGAGSKHVSSLRQVQRQVQPSRRQSLTWDLPQDWQLHRRQIFCHTTEGDWLIMAILGKCVALVAAKSMAVGADKHMCRKCLTTWRRASTRILSCVSVSTANRAPSGTNWPSGPFSLKSTPTTTAGSFKYPASSRCTVVSADRYKSVAVAICIK